MALSLGAIIAAILSVWEQNRKVLFCLDYRREEEVEKEEEDGGNENPIQRLIMTMKISTFQFFKFQRF